eukprot:1534773-Rhodomonas_salina.2
MPSPPIGTVWSYEQFETTLKRKGLFLIIVRIQAEAFGLRSSILCMRKERPAATRLLLLLLVSIGWSGVMASQAPAQATMTGKRKFPDQPKLKLYYFDIKGKGEPIRLLAAYSGLELEDYRFEGRDHFMKLKEDGTLPFGQVPPLA